MNGRWRTQLDALASNLFWCWGMNGSALFRALDAEAWERCHHDPQALLRGKSDGELTAAVESAGLEAAIDDAVRSMEAYLGSDRTWGDSHGGLLGRGPIAYFSAEFGLHESLAIYSGGLGVLAGDHLKSASDLGIPLVGIGLFYREGYFQQTLDAEGWQQESYPIVTPEAKGLRPALDAQGDRIRIEVPTRKGVIHAIVWEGRVGRVRLFLLDTDVPENDQDDRELTLRLYGGNERTRIRQELVLGVGGVKALAALGIRPEVFHLNEGHSAFASLELIATRMEREGLLLDEAIEEIGARTLFTTHTPVPAGHDRFPPPLVLEHLEPFMKRLGFEEPEELLALGRVKPENDDETFCMTVLALKIARRVNGVSFLHGRVSRRMWQSLWPDRPSWEIPIGHITNGVHVPTWMAPRMQSLLDHHLPADWRVRQADRHTWEPALAISDEELWEVRKGLKRDLVAYVRKKASADAARRGESARVIAAMGSALDEDALLIGFRASLRHLQARSAGARGSRGAR